MFTGNEIDVPLGDIKVDGKWLSDTLKALGVSADKAGKKIGLADGSRLRQVIRGNGIIGGEYLAALKEAYPEINLNYILSGQLPILLTAHATKLADAINDVKKRLENLP
jgi:hypothetical protein